MDEKKSSSIWINQIYNVILDLLKNWQIIVFFSVSCALMFDTIQSMRYIPMYRCEAKFAVISSQNFTKNDGENDIGETFGYIFSSNVFKKEIQKALNVDYLNGNYGCELYAGTNLLRVWADSVDAKTAYDMMKGLSENYESISRLVVGDANIDLVNNIVVPEQPYNELNHINNIFKASVVGFGFIVMVLGLLSFFKNTIKDKYDIEDKLNLHLFGSLPRESKFINYAGLKKKKSILVTQYSTSFQYIESFKRIRSRIERYCKKHDAKVIMITSSLENEGKSSVSVNTALSLAMNKHKVLLIDADLRKPSLHLILECRDYQYGINDILNHHISSKDAIIHLENYHLDVLLGNQGIENANEYMNSEALKQLIAEVRNQYDYIIVDSAPSRFLSDSNILATLVDCILLVVKQNFASVPTILNTVERLTLSSSPIMGCINNQSFSLNIHNGRYYGYKYGYNHYYSRRKGS